MFIFALFASIVGLLAACVRASDTPRPLVSPLEGYIAVPMKLMAINDTDGSDVVLEGTFEQLDQQLGDQELSINTTWSHPIDVKAASSDTSLNSEFNTREKSNIICLVGGTGLADSTQIEQGIDYLNHHTRYPCVADPGPGVCTRISCSWGDGIWFCNDTPDEIRKDCPYIAPYAHDIAVHCVAGGLGGNWWVQGQEFDTEGFNVIVGAADC